MRHVEDVDVVGIGIGPSNLSVAALITRASDLTARFCERQPAFGWHPGLLLPDATIQVSFIKDLVTLADPTSPYSFLTFLFKTKRLYQFVTAGFDRVSRLEFNQYFRWVCAELDNVRFGHGVDSVTVDQGALLVEGEHFRFRARHLVMGTGLTPSVPACARPHLGTAVFHAVNYRQRDVRRNSRIAVIGGGQTGAELFADLTSADGGLPREVLWISRRENFLPLDESPFTNELFTPVYSEYFYRLPAREKEHLLAQQKLASDGISESLLCRIYRRLYELKFVRDVSISTKLRPGSELSSLERCPTGWDIGVRDLLTGVEHHYEADYVILCTGFEYALPECLRPIETRIPKRRNECIVRQDFSIEWDGPPGSRIYVQNGARSQRGIADPNLSLSAWRSAVIINSLAGRQVYPMDTCTAVLDLPTTHTPSPGPDYDHHELHAFRRQDVLSRLGEAL